jgi:hypothetical protein
LGLLATIARSSPNAISIDDEETGMKARTKRTQKRRRKLKHRAAVRLVCYPKPVTKIMLVHAAQMANRSLSSFMMLASLKEAAAIKGCSVEDLVPPGELEQYVRVKGR